MRECQERRKGLEAAPTAKPPLRPKSEPEVCSRQLSLPSRLEGRAPWRHFHSHLVAQRGRVSSLAEPGKPRSV